MQETFAHIDSVDLGKHLEHGTHIWKMRFLRVIQVSDYQSDTHLLGKLHILQIHGELVKVD